MQVTPLCELELHYTDVEFVDYGAGGQYHAISRVFSGAVALRTGDPR